jgi:tetratricopeptide (TPR) repeat protein
MEKPNPNASVPPEHETSTPFQRRWRRRSARVKNTFEPRNLWWRLLDALEKGRALRWTLYLVVTVLVLGVASWAWFYPRWVNRNALSIGHQWIAAGRLDHAAETAREAMEDSPQSPEAWQLAAEVARRRKNPVQALNYSHRAALLAPDNPDFTLEWAEDALLTGQPDVAEHALAGLPTDVVTGSARAQRIAGEIARRRVQLTAARDHFANALRLDGPGAADEIPLGGILIFSRDDTERKHGLALLTKWAPDPLWGAGALRLLLGDALDHDDHPAMLKWAEALRAHPQCTLADVPTCLLALSKSDEALFVDVVAILEKKQSGSSSGIALLAGWLNQIGRASVALQWAQSLPPDLTKKPPAAVVLAESFRRTSDWAGLNAWVTTADWGRDVEFIRYAYAMLAARQLGDRARAEEFWRTIQSDAQVTGGHGLFTADTLYTWGWHQEALTLLWLAADQSGVAWEALGTLARHYQQQRDATGLYQVFRRLYALRPADAAIANNFVLFATLTGNEAARVERIARDNHAHAPANVAYLSTYAFVLLTGDHASDAVALLKPVAREWRKSSALAFADGLALAAVGRKEEARPLLTSFDLATLTTREAELIKAALN